MIPAPTELLLLLALAVLLFGASRIPRLARALGQSTREFQRGRTDSETDRTQ